MTQDQQHITLPYGNGALEADVPWADVIGVLDVAEGPPLGDIGAAFTHALEHPIGQAQPLRETVRPGDVVTIIVSDSFRKTGIHHLLPQLLRVLTSAGVREEDIRFLFATGTHRGPTPEEAAEILGEDLYARFHARAFSHDPHDEAGLVYLGTTSRGTPVKLNRLAVETDRVIVTGAVVLHYFGGFGGGRKAILPGVAGVETIAANHARNLHPREDTLNPDVEIGRLAGNPVAEDMAEGAAFCRCDLLINTVLDRHGKIAGIHCGDLVEAHAAACQQAHALFAVPIAQRADLVVATAGSAKNWVQSHKALFNAYQAVKPGGRIVMAAQAPEGFGGNKFGQWVALGSREAIIAELRRNAEINGQTALSTLEKAAITDFVTELSEADVALMGGRRADTLQQAIDHARTELQRAGVEQPTCYVMPAASYTVPMP
jgi:nickel-dependent lactate racemase